MKAFLPGALALLVTVAGGLAAQDIKGDISRTTKQQALAVPDFRGSGAAQSVMGAFNATLQSELQNAGIFRIVSKSVYPLGIPQQPSDFRPPTSTTARGRTTVTKNGPWLTDWSEPPVSADLLAFGYTAVQNNRLALAGFLFNVRQPDVANAQLLGKFYYGSVDENGARQIAREFAADILAKFGVQGLTGSKVYFISARTGTREIWSMDYDGSNQKQFTFYRSILATPGVSPDGTRIAFTSYTRVPPVILIHSTESGRKLNFYNQNASLNTTPDFTPDGKGLVFASTLGGGGYSNIYASDIQGGNLHRLTAVRATEVEPKVNPRTGREVVFVSGRGGAAQLYLMSIDGSDVTRLTTGEGEAVNPSWSPDGSKIAFAWTRGYEPGNFNIFLMDVATRQYVQLTQGAGKNENPTWAPDGRHLVFASNRNGSTQVFTMLADGSQVKQLTTQGRNEKPVWGKQ